MFRKSVLFILGPILVVSCTPTSPAQPDGDYVVDVNDTHGFEVRRPADW